MGEVECGCAAGRPAPATQTLTELEWERGLWGAARDGEVERVAALLARGAPPSRPDSAGYTALHYAARAGHSKVVQVGNPRPPCCPLLGTDCSCC